MVVAGGGAFEAVGDNGHKRQTPAEDERWLLFGTPPEN